LAGVPLRARLLVAAAAIAVYVPLAGGGPSIQRAGVMGVAGLAAALAGRPARRWYALGLAAAATLVLNPRAAGEPGWQLPFAAVHASPPALAATAAVVAAVGAGALYRRRLGATPDDGGRPVGGARWRRPLKVAPLDGLRPDGGAGWEGLLVAAPEDGLR